MRRTGLVLASLIAAVWADPVGAAGRTGADICTNAGFRAGTLSFDLCVTRVDGDDPMAGLEQAVEDERVPVDGNTKPADPSEDALSALEPERIKPPVAPVKPPVRDGEFPSVKATGLPGGGLPGGEPPPGNSIPPPPIGNPPPPAGNGGGFVTPTPPSAPSPPTPPQINTFTVTVPGWNWGGGSQ